MTRILIFGRCKIQIFENKRGALIRKSMPNEFPAEGYSICGKDHKRNGKAFHIKLNEQ
jgi:hypothetical protein